MDTRTSPQPQRLQRLRDELTRDGVHALLVPSSDPHLSEYLPARWQARQWLCGFTGSMGTLVVTRERAALFADSRYWVHLDWLVEQVPRGGVVAVDAQVLGLAAAQALQSRLDAAGITLRTTPDPIDAIWSDRPALPLRPIYAHRAPHAPLARADKLTQVRQAMARHGATYHFMRGDQ